jgi:glycosyltransferase involved in cell wall biosynthesis
MMLPEPLSTAMGTRRKVLLITQDLARAGAQRQCVELALGLQQRPGWSAEVMSLEGEGPLSAELDRGGIIQHHAPRRWRWDLSPAAAVAALARNGRYDVLHSFLFLPNFYTRLSRLLHRPPAVISSLRSTGVPGWPRYAAEVLTAPLCDRIIANSEAGMRSLVRLGVSAKRLAVVPNGLELGLFLEVGRQRRTAPHRCPRRIGMVARFEPDKDHRTLVRAMARVVTEVPDARLVLAGDGSLRPKIESLIQAEALQGCVDLPGMTELPSSIYRDLDIYVQASATSGEGTSNSIIEAMASGLPVVATDRGGNREVVQHASTGLLVPANDPQALAKALLSLMRDSDLARRMGEEGSARAVERYGRAMMIEATIRVYESILDRSQKLPSPPRSADACAAEPR